MEIPFYQIDAFTSRVFAGNPAGVCFLDAWPEDGLLQSIAAENNLAETAFIVARADGSYDLRWFTPKMEVDLCGHATLASAFAIFESVAPSTSAAVFHTKSGVLSVARRGDLLVMDFPSRPPQAVEPPPNLPGMLGLEPLDVLASRDLFVVLEKEDQVRCAAPDLAAAAALDAYLGLIITARGESADFVSRFFAPRAGIPEDPVTGSAHCTLVPYWSKRLGKKHLHALQVSARGGELFCVDEGARVLIGGKAASYLPGKITV